MGSPTIYFYPEGSLLRTVTLPRLSRWEDVPQPQGETLITGSLAGVQVVRGVRRIFRITVERVSMLTSSGLATFRALEAVVSHLHMGGAIGISADHDKTWAGYPGGTGTAGSSYITYQGNAFRSWSASAAPVAGDGVMIEQAPIYGLSEHHKVSTLTGAQLSLDGTTLQFTHGGRSALIRYYRFLPAARLAFDNRVQMLTNEHGITFSLELVLEMDAAVYVEPNGPLDNLGLGDTSASALQADRGLGAILRATRQSGQLAGAPEPEISYSGRQRLLGRL